MLIPADTLASDILILCFSTLAMVERADLRVSMISNRTPDSFDLRRSGAPAPGRACRLRSRQSGVGIPKYREGIELVCNVVCTGLPWGGRHAYSLPS
jgi:hypothetical protein